MSKIIVPWAIGAETLLRSAMISPVESRTIFMVEDLENFSYNTEDPYLYLAVHFWRDWNAGSLNLTYFKLGEGSYRVLLPE